MEQILDGQARQQSMDSSVWRAEKVVEARVNPALMVLFCPEVGVNVRRRCDRERMHVVLGIQNVRGKKLSFRRAGTRQS